MFKETKISPFWIHLIRLKGYYLGGVCVCICLSVCLSDCPHAVIGRQPSRDVE